MAMKTVEMMETGKYPLNPDAKETLNLLVQGVSERIGSDCVNFVAGLRTELQSDVAMRCGISQQHCICCPRSFAT